jgi:hypothetical protein
VSVSDDAPASRAASIASAAAIVLVGLASLSGWIRWREPGFVLLAVGCFFVAPVWYAAPMRNDLAFKRRPLSRRNALLSVIGYWLFVFPGLAWLVLAWRAGRLHL